MYISKFTKSLILRLSENVKIVQSSLVVIGYLLQSPIKELLIIDGIRYSWKTCTRNLSPFWHWGSWQSRMNSQWRPFKIFLPFWLAILLFKLSADALEPRARTISLKPGTSWALLLHCAPKCSPYRLACWWCPSLGCTLSPSPPWWETSPES